MPHDVKSGDIVFTADSEGARIGVSLSPINPNVASTVPAKLERHQVTLEGQGVKDGDKIYVYVASSNNLNRKVYTVTIHTVKLGLGTLEVTRDDADTKGPVTDNKGLTPERTDTVTIDGKDYTRYTTYVPNYTTSVDGNGTLIYNDDIRNAIMKVLGEENAEVSVIPVPGTAITGQDGEWNFDMTDRVASTRVMVTVSATPYAADGDKDGAGHISTALKRTYVVDVYRQDSDTGLKNGGVTYDWLEVLHEGNDPVEVVSNLLKTGTSTEERTLGNTVPEAVYTFNVNAAANSPSAKVDVRWLTPEYDINKIDFSKAANSVRVTDLDLRVVDAAEGIHGQIVITVESSMGTREAHIFDMERVVKTVMKAGITGKDAFSDVEEFLNMADYLASNDRANTEPAKVEKDDPTASRVLVAIADPKLL